MSESLIDIYSRVAFLLFVIVVVIVLAIVIIVILVVVVVPHVAVNWYAKVNGKRILRQCSSADNYYCVTYLI